MPIQFSLKACPFYRKPTDKEQKYAVKEFYTFESGEQILDVNGVLRPKYQVNDIVDEGIKAQHPAEYAAFSAYVAKNDTALYDECHKNPGVALNVSKLMADEAKAIAGAKAVNAKKASKKES